MDNFFVDFNNNKVPAQALQPSNHDMPFDMPPMFVGSDTGMGRPMQQMGGSGFTFDDNMYGHYPPMAHNGGLPAGLHGQNFTNTAAFQNPLIAQLESAASMQPAYTQGWQQSFGGPNSMQRPGQLGMDFGTDSRFQPSGYHAPQNPMDPDLPQAYSSIGEWLEPASASTTQPNTQPSSPNSRKKRTYDDFRNGARAPNGVKKTVAQPASPQSNHRRRKSTVKAEKPSSSSRPATPLSDSKLVTPVDPKHIPVPEIEEHDEDAEAEEDEEEEPEQPRSPSPAPWPGSKPRPPRNLNAPPPKPPRKKKVVTPKAKPVSTRVPLSSEQKKLNHTNSEQRRRDATQRSYAELYDLVPELDAVGKQSTMKKLEIVVDKVAMTKQRVEELRAKLGLDPETGRPLGGNAGTGGAGMLLYSDVPGWRQ
jgi:hypothetical protein